MPTSIPWDNNWQRTYKITIGVREYTKTEPVAEVIVFDATKKELETKVTESTSTIIPSDAITIDNLTDPRGFTFEFDGKAVASSSGGSSEDSTLTLYNITEEMIRILELPNCMVIIEAGYEGKTTLCYTGDVVDFMPMSKLPTTSYKIRLAAEANAMRNETINTHYDEGMSTQDIILDMSKRFSGVSLATYGLNDYNDRYKTGGTGFTGSLITNFDMYMQKNNLEYTFSNNKLYIIPYRIKGQDYSDFATTNYTLSADSIKMVKPQANHTKKSNTDVKNKIKKLQVNTFYLPIEIGQFVTIPSDEYLKKYAGTYIVKGRRIVLQSKGNAWDVVLQVEEVAQ